MVLGRGADQGRAADVDLLHRLGLRHAGARHGLLEGIEVHDDHLDRDDAMMMALFLVRTIPAPVEDAAVHRRVKRLDPAAEELRVSGDLGDIAHRDACVFQRRPGASGGDDLDSVPREPVGELDQPGLVRDGQERAADPDFVHRGRGLPVIPASASS